MADVRLPSWRPGAVKTAIGEYLDGITDVPVENRIAYIDNDGTMWCERPRYIQLDFFVNVLRQQSSDNPSLTKRAEFAAVLNNDAVAMGEIGLAKIAVALAGLFDGQTSDAFAAAVDTFIDEYRHPRFGTQVESLVYQPMLELLEELRAHEFTVGIVSGGGTEFVRCISPHLYGVPPELVVGTLIGYQFGRDDHGRPMLRRTVSLMGEANEGAAKVEHIQAHLGRAPIVAVGNSAGDREMLEWAHAGPHPGLAILIDHDDAEREYAYESRAATFDETEPITAIAERLGWITVSMTRDWKTVFPP